MSTEKAAEIRLQLLKMAQEFSPSSYEDAMKIYERLKNEVGV